MSAEQDRTRQGEPGREPPPQPQGQETTAQAAGQEQPAAQEELPVRQPGEQPSAPPEQEQEPAAAQEERGALDATELRDRWHRAVADLDNLRKRHAKELQQVRAKERARTAAALLPVIDNLELALEHAGSGPSAVLKGVETVRDQAVEAFGRLGYPRYEETGVPFDPARHEVVGVVDTGADDDAIEPNTVVKVVRPGYGAGDDLLRPASVVVSKRQE